MKIVRGRILEILECWPLELVVQTGDGEQRLTLAESCRLASKSTARSISELRIGEEIECRLTADGLVDAIESD